MTIAERARKITDRIARALTGGPGDRVTVGEIEAMIVSVADAEREECAKIAEKWVGCNFDGCATSILDAIRARGNPAA